MKVLRKTVARLLPVFMTLIGGLLICETPVFGVTASSISISTSTLSPVSLLHRQFSTTAQTITVATDNYTGYNLTLTTSGSSTSLVNVSDSSLTIPTITLPSGSSSITSASFDNEYGFSTDGTNYYPVPNPSGSGTTLKTTSASGTDSMTLTFGMEVDSSTSPGTYQNTFVITAVVNNPQYSITYNANTTDTVSNMPSNVSTTISNTGTVDISAMTPTRSGYAFLGWDEDSTVTSNPTYAPGDTIALEPTQANGITLYAIWGPINYNYYLYIDNDGTITSDSYLNTTDTSHTFTIPTLATRYTEGLKLSGFAETSGGSVAYQSGDTVTLTSTNQTKTLYAVWDTAYMQDFSCSVLTTTYETALLTDSRDNEQYNVALLSDDNCWMTDNLRLGTTAVGGSITLDSSTSNVSSSGFTLTNIQNSGSTSWSSTASHVYIQNGINGGLYNWYTAVAGSTTTSSSTEASYSICPSGWRLPTGKNGGEFATMLYDEGILASASANGYKDSSTGRAQMMASPLNFPLSGNYGTSGLAGVGSSGGHWTSTGYSSTQAYNMTFTSSVAGVNYVSVWERGRSIRCIAQ